MLFFRLFDWPPLGAFTSIQSVNSGTIVVAVAVVVVAVAAVVVFNCSH